MLRREMENSVTFRRVYNGRSEVLDHLNKATQAFPSLSIREDEFTLSNGQTNCFFNLTGTIPVVYHDVKYNIPIKIWLLQSYPGHAPVCYVTPTLGMNIQVSDIVDHTGKVYLPYLHEWQERVSDLVVLIRFMALTFSEKMPVVSKNTSIPPDYPVYPTSYYSGFPPYPRASSMPTPQYPLTNPMPTPPYPTQQRIVPSIMPYGQTGQTTPYPPYQSFPQPPMPQPVTATGTINEGHIRASLVSAVEDKIRQNMRESTAQWTAELETLEKIQSELNQGKERIMELMGALERERSEWEKVLTTLRDKDLELDAALLNISNQGDVDVDEAVDTTAPLYKQLLTAFAEEAATEDAIYYLGEALRRGVIDLDIFLKHVRSLSRKQFMLRALMNKCRNKAGLF